MRVEGPTSGLTYGAEAWTQTVYDFNDGNDHLINFTWEADVLIGHHYDHYYIQVTDGYIPYYGSVHWPRNQPYEGTIDFLWEDVGGELRAGAVLTYGLPKSTWSLTISADGTGRLYDGPDGGGSLVYEGMLDPSYAWHIRFMVIDATSSGFPAGDDLFNIYDLSAEVIPSPPDPDLIAYYPFDGHAQDESGNGNHGTNYGAVATTDHCGNENSALYFNGAKVIIDNVDILPQGEIFTVSLWAEFDVLTGDHTVFDKREFQSSWENVLNLMIQDSYDPDALAFRTFNTVPEPTATHYSTDNLTTDTWYLITTIYDNTKMYLYVDTTLVDTATASLTLNSTAEELWFGSNDKPYDPNYLLGSLDEIYIYKRALSKAEIVERYLYDCMAFQIDIKPQSCPNPLNTKSKGVLPVAILGTSGFDVYDVDPVSILLEGVSPLRWSYEDVAAPVGPSGDVCDCTDQGPDGFMDLTLKFKTQEIVAALGSVTDGEIKVLTLTGMTQDSTVIEGQDCVVIIDKDHDKKPTPLGMRGGGIMTEFGTYPNPFNAETEIRFGLLEGSEVSLVVYNILGEEVRTLVSADLDAGIHRIHWDGRDAAGSSVASGIYFCRLKTETAARTMKMIMLR
jgi:hypothetical protein